MFDTVADVYAREESRATVKMRHTEPFPDELPTKPDVIKRTERRVRMALWLIVIVAAVCFGIAILALALSHSR